MNDAPRKVAPWRVFDNPKYCLFAEKQEHMEKPPKLAIGIYEDNPRIRIKTQIPNDRNNGNIDAAFSGPGFYSFMELLRHVAEHDGPIEMFESLDGHPFINGQRSREQLPMSRLRVAKENDGMITITVTAGKNRPIIVFPFMQDGYHHFQDADGNPMDVALASKFACLGWVNLLTQMVAAEIVKHTEKPEWMNRNQGGYQNNNQNNNQSRGGYGGGNSSGYGNRDRGGYSSGGGGNARNQPQAPSNDDYSFDSDVPL